MKRHLPLIEPSHFLISAARKLRRDGEQFQDAYQRWLNHWKATDSYCQNFEALRSTSWARIPLYRRELKLPPEEDRRGASLKRRPYHMAAEQARRGLAATEGQRRTRAGLWMSRVRFPCPMQNAHTPYIP